MSLFLETTNPPAIRSTSVGSRKLNIRLSMDWMHSAVRLMKLSVKSKFVMLEYHVVVVVWDDKRRSLKTLAMAVV